MIYLRTPGPMGDTCDNIITNPAWVPETDTPPLAICGKQAIVKILFMSDDIMSVTKRCPACQTTLSATRGVKIVSVKPLTEGII